MEAFDDVGLEGFPLFLVWVLVLICDEISVCAVKGEHQAMKFTVSGDGIWRLGVRSSSLSSRASCRVGGCWICLANGGVWMVNMATCC